MLDAFSTLRAATSLIHLPRVSETEIWIKPFRRQIEESWYVRNNRGRIRLIVRDAGTVVSLPFELNERDFALALPRIQQIFKRKVIDHPCRSRAKRRHLQQSPEAEFQPSRATGSSSPTLATRHGRL